MNDCHHPELGQLELSAPTSTSYQVLHLGRGPGTVRLAPPADTLIERVGTRGGDGEMVGEESRISDRMMM